MSEVEKGSSEPKEPTPQPAEKLTPAQIQEQVQTLRLLDMERADLGYKLFY